MARVFICTFLICVASLVGATGCSLFAAILPDTRTPEQHAQALEKRCKDFSDPASAALLDPRSLDSVEPAYAYVQTGNDRRANMRGARIHVKPLPGLSPEAMGRSLECHQADVVLRGAASPVDDPYVLPGKWVEFDVSSESDGFVVLAHVPSIDDANVLLARARRFVAARGH